MEKMQAQERDRDQDRWNQLKSRMHQAYKAEEESWSKKVKVNWLKERDKNTKYFHAVTAERMKMNRIQCIKLIIGVNTEGKKRQLRRFQGTLRVFTTQYPEDYDEVFEGILEP